MSKITLSPNASGTGTFTIASPNSNTDRTLTLPDASGTILTTATPGVPVNGPAFLVTVGSIQTISASTWTKLALNTELFDTNSNFDSTTNYRFTPTVAGYYQFNSQVNFLGGNINAFMSIYKNGSLLVQGSTTPTASGASGQILTLATLLYANGTTDYFEIYGYSGGTQINSGLSNTNFSGFLARSAT